MVWILVFLASLSAAEGNPAMSARHVATVVSVYDGDTITVDVELWPGLTWRGKVRVRGVDTPEIQTKSDAEKRRALLARDFVRERIGKVIYLENVKLGNFAGAGCGDRPAAGRVRPREGTDPGGARKGVQAETMSEKEKGGRKNEEGRSTTGRPQGSPLQIEYRRGRRSA